jgi:6-phosphogluconolactonase
MPGAGTGGGAGAGPTQDPVVYIGGSSEVRIYDFKRSTGEFSARTQAAMLGPSPSYIAVSPNKTCLVVTNEDDGSMGGLTSATISSTGDLVKVNHVTGSDGGFTYVAISPNGQRVAAASYNGGSVSIFSLGTDCTLGGELDNRDFGSDAQTHCAAYDASGTHLLVPNKGNDEVAQLVVGTDGMLSANTPASVMTVSGAGPRHIAVHPNGKLAFVIDELDSTMTPYQVSSSFTLTAGTPVTTLPSGFNGQNTGAHVEITPDGKYVYGSNRGDDSIVAFSADQSTGALTLVGHQDSGGQTPRDFDMDPYGAFLIVANQGNSRVAALSIGSDGKLTPLGDPVAGPAGGEAAQIVYLP